MQESTPVWLATPSVSLTSQRGSQCYQVRGAWEGPGGRLQDASLIHCSLLGSQFPWLVGIQYLVFGTVSALTEFSRDRYLILLDCPCDPQGYKTMYNYDFFSVCPYLC